MAKKILLVAMVILLSAGSGFAAQTGGTHPIVDGSLIALALEYDYVFDRDLTASGVTSAGLDDASAYYLKFSAQPAKFMSIYAKIGGTNFNVESTLANGNELVEDYDTGLFIGGGVKFAFELMPNVNVGIDNQFNWWKSDIGSAKYPGAISEVSGDRSGWEYQLAGILSYDINWNEVVNPVHGEWPRFSPYIGVKYSKFELDNNITVKSGGTTLSIPGTLENDNKAGFIYGLDIVFDDVEGFTFNLEGRLIDETAISGNINYNF